MRVFGTHDENTRAQLMEVGRHARKVALMADGHVGYVMPIGGVAAYENAVSVAGVGFDIACGNAAIRTDANLRDFGGAPARSSKELAHLADRIVDTVSFGVGRKNRAGDAPTDDALFDDPAWTVIPTSHREALHTKARQQLGPSGVEIIM